MVVRHALKVFVDLFLVFHIVNKQIPSPLGFLFRAHVFFSTENVVITSGG